MGIHTTATPLQYLQRTISSRKNAGSSLNGAKSLTMANAAIVLLYYGVLRMPDSNYNRRSL